MARVKIELPSSFIFTTDIPVRITDINYGGHVGNDAILSIIHESRVQFLLHLGFEELNVGGPGLIMSDVVIDFKQELFYGNQLKVSVTTGDFTRATFDIFYKMESLKEDKRIVIAVAKTGMVCFDYKTNRVTSLPEKFKSMLVDE